ncbi:ABC transporter substrate-binding protein, partial [Leifsonia sp. SIMBA_070]
MPGSLALTAGPASAPAAFASDQSSGKTLKLALTGDIDTLNPFKAILATSSNILALQYQNLVAYGPEQNEEIPGMAESWE